MSARKLIYFSFSLAVGIYYPAIAHAQTVDIPSVIDQPRKSMEEKPSVKKPVKPEAVGKDSEKILSEAPEGSEAIIFKLEKLNISGATVYKDAQLEKFYSAKIGKTVKLSEIFEIAAEIKRKYRNDGYILTHVIVPEQDIEGGQVKLQVVEGYIKNIEYKGEAKSAPLAKKIISKVKNIKALNIKDLEKVLLLANEVPGILATSTLVPIEGDDAGAVNLVVEFNDKKKISQLVTFDNNGSRYLGPYQAGYYVKASNIIPNQETTLSVVSTVGDDELVLGGITQSAVVNDFGTNVSLDLSHSRVAPGYKIKQQDIEGNGYYGTLTVSQPILRSRRDNLTISSGFSWKDIKSTALDSPLYEDRLRTLHAELDYSGTDKFYGSNAASFEITKGLNIFGARETGEPNLSRSEGVSDFTKFNAELSRQQGVTENTAVYVATRGQYSVDPLLSSEEFAYGGNIFGRGYDPSELAGDDGISATIELRYFGSPALGKFQYQPFVFYDAGKIWNQDLITATEDATATSAGTGLRFNIGESLAGDVTVAVPLKRPASAPQSGNGKLPKILFSVYCPI